MSESLKSEILAHFDELAPQYDNYKVKNAFYYQAIKNVLRENIPKAVQSIAEIGCGTGDLLVSLKPTLGLGVDLSPAMIQQCQIKHQQTNFRFEVGDAENLPSLQGFEAIFLADVIEHLSDLQAAIASLAKAMDSKSLLILTWANHLWTPILDLAEKFGLKMPEGPHIWFSPNQLIGLLQNQGFQIERHTTHLLCPMRLAGFGPVLNRTLGRLPGFRKLGVIRIVVARKN